MAHNGNGHKKPSMLKNKSTSTHLSTKGMWHHSLAAGGSSVSFEHVDLITMVDKSIQYNMEIVVELLSISRNLLTYTGENNFSIK